jgi:hypothetical protein
MSQETFRATSSATLLFGSSILLTLAGCYNPPSEAGYRSQRPARVAQVVDQDDYVYYPGYEVYYNNTRRQYVYRDGNSWVNRPEPPRVWAQRPPDSYSVHVDFHDAPERHHPDIIKKYPHDWKPEPSKRPEGPDQRRDDHRDDRKGDGRRDH